MPSPTDASAVELLNLAGHPRDHAPSQTKVLQHRRLTIRVTSNEPSAAAAENFRTSLYQLIMRLIDPGPTL